MIKRAFTEHPATVGETYGEHLGQASSFGFAMIGGGVCCLLHGLFPFLFERTGSRCIETLHQRMVTHRDRRAAPESAEGQAKSGSSLDAAA